MTHFCERGSAIRPSTLSVSLLNFFTAFARTETQHFAALGGREKPTAGRRHSSLGRDTLLA